MGTRTGSREITIEGVKPFTQNGDTIYSFTLNADEVVARCRVERFNETRDGVNRLYDPDHAFEIAEAMKDQELLWMEPIMGDLQGPWTFADGRLICAEDEGYISIDDGQHRRMALELLTADERAGLTFQVAATINLPLERRLAIFRMQDERKPLDRHMILQINDRLGSWESPVDQETYQILVALNGRPNSPLYQRVIMTETVRPKYRAQHQLEGIPAKGLFATIKRLIGSSSRSPLYRLSPERRYEVIESMLIAASEVWSRAWDKTDTHMLQSARGINSVLLLLVSSPNFRGLVGSDFSAKSIRAALECGKSFNWSREANRNQADKAIVMRLDQSIGRKANAG